MRLFDSHCHLDFPAFDADRAEVLARAAAAGVGDVVVPGYSPATWPRAAALTHTPEGLARVHVAVGLHPYALAESSGWHGAGPAAGRLHPSAPADSAGTEEPREDDALTQQLVDAAARFGAVAIGECGLDGRLAKRAEGGVSLALQERVLRAHVHAAALAGLPLILHVVNAHEAALALLHDGATHAAGNGPQGVVHAFSGSVEVGRRYVRLGFRLAFGGALTHTQHKRAREAAAWVPDEALLLESDAPSGRLAGGPERNEPCAVREVLAVLAALRGQSEQHVADLTRRNALALFRVAEPR